MAIPGPEIVKALNHPYRRTILRLLLEGKGKTASSSQISGTKDTPLVTVAYHMNTLVKLKLVLLDSTRQVRGATERFYRVADLESDTAWVKGALRATRDHDNVQLSVEAKS